MQRGSNVLVHCRAGAHRAATMVALIILFLLREQTVPQVTKMIKEKRRVTQIDGDNRLLLHRFWNRLQQEDEQPASPAAPAADEEAQEEDSEEFDWSASPSPSPGEENVVGDGCQAAAPAAQQTTTAADEAAPAAQQTTPAADEAAPAAQQTTPAADEAAPAAQQTTPAADEAAPAADEAAPAGDEAAPAAARASYWDAVQRLLLMSWNPGNAARRLPQVLDTTGYHIVVLQNATASVAQSLPEERWSSVLSAAHLVACRKPATAKLLWSSDKGVEWKGQAFDKAAPVVCLHHPGSIAHG